MVMVLVLLGWSPQVEAKRSPVLEALCYLARHQRDDGSWGDRKDPCAAPPGEANAASSVADRAGPLVRALGDDDPAVRESAENELQALGVGALESLRKALWDPDPEIRSRTGALVRRIEVLHRASDAELTGQALLAFLGAGYSHLSRDEYDGLSFGTVVRKGLTWLLMRERDLEIASVSDAATDIVATLALSEAYGMTASKFLKEPAQRAIDRAAATSFSDSRGLIWKGFALKSAELNELVFPKRAFDDVLGAIASQKGDRATAGYSILSIYWRKDKKDPRLADIRSLDFATLEIETLHFATLATFQLDGPDGPAWNACREPVKNRLLSSQCTKEGDCEKGSWDAHGLPARLRATALNVQTLEIYYRYCNLTAASR